MSREFKFTKTGRLVLLTEDLIEGLENLTDEEFDECVDNSIMITDMAIKRMMDSKVKYVKRRRNVKPK